jgi:hypothetical protein
VGEEKMVGTGNRRGREKKVGTCNRSGRGEKKEWVQVTGVGEEKRLGTGNRRRRGEKWAQTFSLTKEFTLEF